MTASEAGGDEGRSRSFNSYWALGALVLGLAAGALVGDRSPEALATAEFVGALWLNALKMTVIPLVVSLLVVGIAKSREAAAGGRIAARTMLWIVIVCTAAAIFGTAAILLLTHAFPLPRGTAEGLQAALGGVEQNAPLAGVADFFKGMVPSNIFAAASNGDILPLVVFSVLFALALATISTDGRQAIVRLFEAIADAFLVIIGWVLWLAPLGVLALAYTVGAAAGGAAFAGFGHYVVLISIVGLLVMLAGYPLAALAGGVSLGRFAKAMIGPQAVAISTRSSLACLPAMLTATRTIGVWEQVADVALPIAVALFRATGPAMNVAVSFYVAHWLGYHPGLAQIIAATAVAAVMSYGAVSLPGEVSYISSIAPINLALGVPIAPLALLVAVEMVPDIFRTLGNVTLDVAATAIVGKGADDGSSS